MNLYVDIGNSAIKWTLGSSEPLHKSFYNDDLENTLSALIQQIKDNGQIDNIYYASVAAPEITAGIEQLLHQHTTVSLHRLRTDSYFGDICNDYTFPQQLGVDRWLTAIGALTQFQQPMIVCDFGSAISIDYICDKRHFIGGYILPGISMQLRSLLQGTAIQFSDYVWPTQRSEYPPQNTVSAITMGIVTAVADFITARYLSYSSNYESLEIRLICTGGDAAIIASLLKVPYVIKENLIFSGMEKVAASINS